MFEKTNNCLAGAKRDSRFPASPMTVDFGVEDIPTEQFVVYSGASSIGRSNFERLRVNSTTNKVINICKRYLLEGCSNCQYNGDEKQL